MIGNDETQREINKLEEIRRLSKNKRLLGKIRKNQEKLGKIRKNQEKYGMIANLTGKRNKNVRNQKKLGKIRKNQKKIGQEKLGKIWKFPNFS